MTTLAAWRPATAYAKSATVRPVASPGSVPVPITNGNFNSGATAWTLDAGWAISTGDSYEGTYKAIFTGAGSGTIKVSGTYPATAGQVITATVKARVLDAADGATAFLKWYDASNVLLSTTTGLESSVETGVWMQLSVVGLAPANTAYVVFGVEATRTVGASVTIDDARWDYTAPIEARRVAYRAVQETAGVSGAVEPTWPTTLGARVNDGTVVWEAVELAWIEWTARPILESGLTEPVWPTTVGAFVSDGTINWECTSRRVEDENCPQSKVVAIIASKVFAADKDIVRFSATANPLDWTSRDDAGYLPTGLQQSNANDLAVLQPYRGNLGGWNANVFQMWQVDPDPTNMALLDQMDGVGSTHTLAATAVGNDLFYLAAPGVRSVGIANAAENLQAGDVGMPIDVLVQAALTQWAADGQKALSTYWPGMGQYWLCGADQGVTAGAGGALRLICSPQGGEVGTPYSYTFTATGGTAPYVFDVYAGTLPTGLTLDEDTGELTGTPTEAGSFSFTIRVTDALNVEAFCSWSGPVEDEVVIEAGDLLVTGEAILGGGPVFATAKAIATPVFTGIPQSTGATIDKGVPVYYGGTWVVVDMGADHVAQKSTSITTAWTTVTTDRATTGYLSAGPGGLLVGGDGAASVFDGTATSIPMGSTIAPYAFATEHPPGTPLRANGEESFMNRRAGGYYWIDTGAQGELVKATDITSGTQQVVFVRGVGQNYIFYDIEVLGGDVYAAVYNADNLHGEVRKSTDGGATFPTLVIDTSPFGAAAPMYLKAGGGRLLILARNSSVVWTSDDGFATPRSTGIVGETTGTPTLYARMGRGQMIEYANARFYIVSSPNLSVPALGDKCVVTTDGITFGSAITLPIIGVTGIASSNPVT